MFMTPSEALHTINNDTFKFINVTQYQYRFLVIDDETLLDMDDIKEIKISKNQLLNFKGKNIIEIYTTDEKKYIIYCDVRDVKEMIDEIKKRIVMI